MLEMFLLIIATVKNYVAHLLNPSSGAMEVSIPILILQRRPRFRKVKRDRQDQANRDSGIEM